MPRPRHLPTATGPGSKKAQRGFTLIELMIVIVLIGIVAVIAVPNFTQFINKSRTQSFHNELVALLQYTRSAAVEQRTFVKACQGATAWTVKKACTNASETLRHLDIPSTLAVTTTSDEITFRYNGTATDAQLITCQNGDFMNGYTLDVSASGSIKSWPRGQMGTGTNMTTCEPPTENENENTD